MIGKEQKRLYILELLSDFFLLFRSATNIQLTSSDLEGVYMRPNMQFTPNVISFCYKKNYLY